MLLLVASSERILMNHDNRLTFDPTITIGHWTELFPLPRNERRIVLSEEIEVPPNENSILKLNQTTPIRRSDRFSPTHDVQLGKDASHVALHGGFTDEQVRADLLIASAAGQQL